MTHKFHKDWPVTFLNYDQIQPEIEVVFKITWHNWFVTDINEVNKSKCFNNKFGDKI